MFIQKPDGRWLTVLKSFHRLWYTYNNVHNTRAASRPEQYRRRRIASINNRNNDGGGGGGRRYLFYYNSGFKLKWQREKIQKTKTLQNYYAIIVRQTTADCTGTIMRVLCAVKKKKKKHK